ncbi:hypothetical protein MPTK1_5g11180 [Marchantia polymorpha subsp. ruderalis]|uniref:Uncharacterized protein n=2 Tax=Marchantia polymorpha TaxID=3197 RepID=A0AAF6BH68_MARPO|nr:hypothetical protein MARPO_0093s0040 [Marchantia polymorpha]BBN11352.1 hypothetical protein Mp_5g11180 [Marchantia polymorpha subsp. ruderalis]|eukprot:PTQ32961.1 hypothetical protein MARPO_0093s0040 [Marchantia polymorpha]
MTQEINLRRDESSQDDRSLSKAADSGPRDTHSACTKLRRWEERSGQPDRTPGPRTIHPLPNSPCASLHPPPARLALDPLPIRSDPASSKLSLSPGHGPALAIRNAQTLDASHQHTTRAAQSRAGQSTRGDGGGRAASAREVERSSRSLVRRDYRPQPEDGPNAGRKDAGQILRRTTAREKTQSRIASGPHPDFPSAPAPAPAATEVRRLEPLRPGYSRDELSSAVGVSDGGGLPVRGW